MSSRFAHYHSINSFGALQGLGGIYTVNDFGEYFFDLRYRGKVYKEVVFILECGFWKTPSNCGIF
jgi:hypothetical protein